MSRPKKSRKVSFVPDTDFFKPRGVPMRNLEIVELTMDELEAIRLADDLGKTHEESAEIMDVSRQTFGRIIEKARGKVASALINGKAIRIEGGNYTLSQRVFRCFECDHEWNEPFGTGRPRACPECGCVDIRRADDGGAKGRGRRRGPGGKGKGRRGRNRGGGSKQGDNR